MIPNNMEDYVLRGSTPQSTVYRSGTCQFPNSGAGHQPIAGSSAIPGAAFRCLRQTPPLLFKAIFDSFFFGTWGILHVPGMCTIVYRPIFLFFSIAQYLHSLLIKYLVTLLL
jgi:hypothetical protein